MTELRELLERHEMTLRAGKGYRGAPLLIKAADPLNEVVVMEAADRRALEASPTATVRLDRAEIEEQLSEYSGSVVAVAKLVSPESRVFSLDSSAAGEAEGLRLGRDSDNDLVLVDPGVSAFHAQMRYAEGRWLLIDHESKNGTYVNKTALVPGDPLPLVSCDCVRFGQAVYYFAAGDQLVYLFVHWLEALAAKP